MGENAERAAVAAGRLAELTDAQLDAAATEIVNAAGVIADLVGRHADNRLKLMMAVDGVLVDLIFNCSEILRGDSPDACHDD